MNTVVLKISHLTKYYDKVIALDGVNFELREGEVHAIVGENGAGKSTLIKSITGAIEPSGGTIEVNGETFTKLNPIESKKLGIGAIYQEFNLVPYLSVAENIFFGNEITKNGFIDFKQMNRIVQDKMDELGINIKPTTKVGNLGVAYQQLVEIVKVIMSDAKILIMDEPTAPLTNNETDLLFKIIARLKEQKVSIIYISHRLEEIFEICDRVTVFRDGKYISTHDVKDATREKMIAEMVGRELGEQYPARNGSDGDVILSVENMTNASVKNVSFELHKGEILGFGGLVGAGRTEVMRAIFGADPIDSGRIIKDGKEIKVRNPNDAFRNGIGLIPEDRKTQGAILGLSIKENITMSNIKNVCKGVFVDNRVQKNECEKLKGELRIKTPDLNQLIKNLSGGNQQKVVLARILFSDCDILIFDEPTRGIDVGAKQEIYNIMKELVTEGKSIIMVSSDMPELLGMSDRILVMNEGQIAGELYPDEYTQEAVLELASLSRDSVSEE